MKTIILISLCLLAYTQMFSQNPEDWQSIEFNSKEDYEANEGKILECANFILSVPAKASDPARQSALGALSKWMSGTPDYQFVIDESIGKLMEKNEAVLSIYMAAMSKYALENNDHVPTAEEMEYNAFDQMLAYSKDSGNNVPMTKELKKAIQARDKGNLKAYLNSN
ncbi:MAG TPA: hypothetical protein VFW11_19180 [Cyclobacteriaceae bacterium]|nr:hypothetical protein [Cyclobacteriaceae bacterium]